MHACMYLIVSMFVYRLRQLRRFVEHDFLPAGSAYVDVVFQQDRMAIKDLVENTELQEFDTVKATRYLGFRQERPWPLSNIGFDNSCYRGTLIDCKKECVV